MAGPRGTSLRRRLETLGHIYIFECIQLSRRTIPMDKGFLLAAATFWCRSSKAFLFRCGPMAPTLLDVCALTSLPVLGAEVSPNLPKLPSDIKFDPKTADSVSYQLWIGTHMQDGPVTPEEHVAFLHCWVCRNLLCTSAVQVTREYLQIAVSLASGRLLPLAPCVLGHIYRGLYEMSLR